MKLYHCTAAADDILHDGFLDGVGTYGTAEVFRGVFLADVPLDINEGAEGETILDVEVDLTDDELSRYEWIEEGKPYREFCLPATVVNARSKITKAEF